MAYYLMRVTPHRDTECARETKVGQLQLEAFTVDQEVLRIWQAWM